MLHTLHPLFLKTTAWGRYYDYPYFPVEGTGTARLMSLSKLSQLPGEEQVLELRPSALADCAVSHSALCLWRALFCFLFCFGCLQLDFILNPYGPDLSSCSTAWKWEFNVIRTLSVFNPELPKWDWHAFLRDKKLFETLCGVLRSLNKNWSQILEWL